MIFFTGSLFYLFFGAFPGMIDMYWQGTDADYTEKTYVLLKETMIFFIGILNQIYHLIYTKIFCLISLVIYVFYFHVNTNEA